MFTPPAHVAPRDALIAIAMDLLDSQHPDDLSLREVARRAGLSSGAPAHHFGNKLGLLAACAETSWAALARRMAAVPDDLEPASAIVAQSRVYITFALEHPGPYRLMMSRQFVEGQRFAEIARFRFEVLHRLLRLIPADEDPQHVARRGLAVWALLHGHVNLVLDLAIHEAKVEPQNEDICRLAATLALAPR